MRTKSGSLGIQFANFVGESDGKRDERKMENDFRVAALPENAGEKVSSPN